MPAGPGESLLTTLFADVHYYFNDPSSKPLHDRFDRGSYVYLFHNAMQRQTKLEIANAAGTPHQDAFFGYVNLAHIRYSYLQPNLLTLLVNTGAVQDHTTWHLPSYDLANETKYLHKIHALDIYLWTEKDAATLLNHFKNVVGVDRMEIKDAPASKQPSAHEHRDSMSPVVQQLERTAISSHFPARTGSTVSAASFPGPPTPAASIAAPQAVGGYNPAAPAAPEPVAYREKTPPPPDDGTGTGLKNASVYDTVPQFQGATGFHPQQSSSSQSTPQPGFYGGYGGPSAAARPAGPTSTPSFGPMAASTLSNPHLAASPPPQQQQQQQQQPPSQFANYPAHLQQQTQFANYPGSPGFNQNMPPTPSAPPAYSGPLQSPGFQQGFQPGFQQFPPQAEPAQQPPIGGYSNYSYSAAQNQAQAQQMGGYAGDTHLQLYRPTEEEMSKHQPKPKRTATDGSGKDGKKISGAAGKLEGKVTDIMSRLDKLW